MAKIDEIIYHEPTQKELDKFTEKCRQCVDYEIGDWVETCNFLPGIVQKINCEKDEVEVFYPHYALRDDCEGKYNGGSLCSIMHCGVHKITPEYAMKLMSIGYKELEKKWLELAENDKGNVLTFDWEKEVEKLYEEKYGRH